jgi:very-short-patch-repair endonuclease
VDERVLEASRHGVIHRDRLLELGLTASDLAYRLQAGRLHRLHKLVYAVGRPDVPLDGRFLGAVLACGPRARLSHRSGGRKYRFLGGGEHRIDVTAPRTIKPKPGIRLHRPLFLNDLDTTVVDGIPITSVARTLLDCSAPSLGVDVGRMLHEAHVQTQFDARDVWAVLARCPNHLGARRLDWALREEHPFIRSGLERALLRLVASAGLPQPRVNHHVWAGDDLLEVDFYWPQAGVIVEVDGARYHSTRWRQRRDAEKTARLRAAGYIVLRFTDAEIAGTPERVIAAITAALGPPSAE